jgi:hypothetical protein
MSYFLHLSKIFSGGVGDQLSSWNTPCNIIEVDHHTLTNQTLKCYVHFPLESCTCINQAKGNPSILNVPHLVLKVVFSQSGSTMRT